MKRVYLFLFIAVLAVAMIVISLMSFNPTVDKWSSLFGGAAIGFLIVRTPSVIAYFKKNKQGSTK